MSHIGRIPIVSSYVFEKESQNWIRIGWVIQFQSWKMKKSNILCRDRYNSIFLSIHSDESVFYFLSLSLSLSRSFLFFNSLSWRFNRFYVFSLFSVLSQFTFFLQLIILSPQSLQSFSILFVGSILLFFILQTNSVLSSFILTHFILSSRLFLSPGTYSFFIFHTLSSLCRFYLSIILSFYPSYISLSSFVFCFNTSLRLFLSPTLRPGSTYLFFPKTKYKEQKIWSVTKSKKPLISDDPARQLSNALTQN